MKQAGNSTESRESNSSQQQQHQYTNPLFQTLTIDDLDEKNFPVFKKKLQKILLDINTSMQKLLEQFSEDLVDDNEKRKKALEYIIRYCKKLKDYCYFFSKNRGKASLSYEYLGTIAHNLKTAGHNIDTLLSLGCNKDQQRKKELFETTKKIIEGYINKSTSQIKTISHLKFKDKSFYEITQFFPALITEDIIEPQIFTIEEKNIKITNSLSKNYSIESNKEIFNIVMDNLLTNAIKFTPKGGTIKIGIEDNNYYSTTFFIKNSGVGITPGIDVFTSGYTSPGLEGQQGTGIGLAQSKAFLNATFGDISHKDAPEGGTIFSFTLPKK